MSRRYIGSSALEYFTMAFIDTSYVKKAINLEVVDKLLKRPKNVTDDFLSTSC